MPETCGLLTDEISTIEVEKKVDMSIYFEGCDELVRRVCHVSDPHRSVDVRVFLPREKMKHEDVYDLLRRFRLRPAVASEHHVFCKTLARDVKTHSRVTTVLSDHLRSLGLGRPSQMIIRCIGTWAYHGERGRVQKVFPHTVRECYLSQHHHGFMPGSELLPGQICPVVPIVT